jgi:phage portal protein BeeE
LPALVVATAAAGNVSGRTAMQFADVFAGVRALSTAALRCPLRYRDKEADREPLTSGRGPFAPGRPPTTRPLPSRP